MMKKSHNAVLSKHTASSAEIQSRLNRKYRVKSVINKRKEFKCEDPPNLVSKSDKLSQQEWEFIEHRAIQQSTPSCAICFGYFRNDVDQVLLSCGHIFHETCCRSFERYCGADHLFCAICRESPYTRKATNLGFISRKKHASILIQCHIRGFIGRKRVRERLRIYFQSETSASNASRKTKFYVKELTDISSRVLRQVNLNESQIDNLISTMERSLEVSKLLDTLCNTFEGIKKANSNIPWELILKTALGRNETIDCAICMTPIEHTKAIVLSCTHVFHSRCFTSLEYFCSIQEENMARQCPVCRSSSFEKMDWFVE